MWIVSRARLFSSCILATRYTPVSESKQEDTMYYAIENAEDTDTSPELWLASIIFNGNSLSRYHDHRHC